MQRASAEAIFANYSAGLKTISYLTNVSYTLDPIYPTRPTMLRQPVRQL